MWSLLNNCKKKVTTQNNKGKNIDHSDPLSIALNPHMVLTAQ